MCGDKERIERESEEPGRQRKNRERVGTTRETCVAGIPVRSIQWKLFTF